MYQPEPSSPDSLRHYAVGVLCVAVLLGGYFMHINASADRHRAEAAERLLLCRQMERVASATMTDAIKLGDSCRQLGAQAPESVTAP